VHSRSRRNFGVLIDLQVNSTYDSEPNSVIDGARTEYRAIPTTGNQHDLGSSYRQESRHSTVLDRTELVPTILNSSGPSC